MTIDLPILSACIAHAIKTTGHPTDDTTFDKVYNRALEYLNTPPSFKLIIPSFEPVVKNQPGPPIENTLALVVIALYNEEMYWLNYAEEMAKIQNSLW